MPPANGMLVSSHAEGKITHSNLIAGGMVNSYLSYVSHSLRVAYPVIGAVGLPAICYFGWQMGFGFLFIAAVLFLHRRKSPAAAPGFRECRRRGRRGARLPGMAHIPAPDVPAGAGACFPHALPDGPLMIGVEWLMKTACFPGGRNMCRTG